MEEWRVALWRQSDRIAMDRTDIAGAKRKRPIKPAQTRAYYGRELGHPSGMGVSTRGEYLTDGSRNSKEKPKQRSSNVGRGQSKWVKTKRKQYTAWNPAK